MLFRSQSIGALAIGQVFPLNTACHRKYLCRAKLRIDNPGVSFFCLLHAREPHLRCQTDSRQRKLSVRRFVGSSVRRFVGSSVRRFVGSSVVRGGNFPRKSKSVFPRVLAGVSSSPVSFSLSPACAGNPRWPAGSAFSTPGKPRPRTAKGQFAFPPAKSAPVRSPVTPSHSPAPHRHSPAAFLRSRMPLSHSPAWLPNTKCAASSATMKSASPATSSRPPSRRSPRGKIPKPHRNP